MAALPFHAFIARLVCLVGLLALPIPASAEPGAPDTSESFYSGKALAFMEIAIDNVDDLEAAFNQDDRDAEWEAEVKAVIRTWDAVLAVAEEAEPPTSLASIHDDLVANLQLFVESGDLFEQGMDQGDDATIAEGNETLQEAIDDTTATLDQLQVFLFGEQGEAAEDATTEREAPTSPERAPSRGPVMVSGVGAAVSDGFDLPAGRFKVTATLEVADFSGFICTLYGPGDFEESLFNEIIDSPQTWTGSTVLNVDEAGEYFVEVDNTDEAWQLRFTPL